MNTTLVIQARMGSRRLPGKVMLGLDGVPIIQRLVWRMQRATSVDDIVVATSKYKRDNILETFAERAGARVYRGSEKDVLGRFHAAVEPYDPDTLVRVCGDCPLLDPAVVDAVVDALCDTRSDYAGNTIERTFPDGIVAEAFTKSSFDVVELEAESNHHREHVTTYYLENPDRFDLVNVTSEAVYTESFMNGRTDRRLALDVASDYERLYRIHESVDYNDVLDLRDAVRYLDSVENE